MGQLRVAVVGAGVVGVTSALEVLSRLPTARVTVIADQFNQDTTSDGAAGIFRPGTSFSGPNPQITHQLLANSYTYYSDLVDSGCGVSRVSGYIFSSTSPSLVRNHLLEGLVPVYRAATASELAVCPGGWKYGSYFETLLTECRYFLPWALDRIKAAGGAVVIRRLSSLSELQGSFDAVINCSGLGARELAGDLRLVPIRGQVIKVEAPWLKHFFYADYDTYVIPGAGGTVTLGGSRHYDSYSTAMCRHDRAAIEERCLALVPSLSVAKQLGSWTGLRPHRDTVRLDTETLGSLKVVHNYGHGGYGVTTAPGSAKYAVDQLSQVLCGSSANCKL